MMAAPDVKNTIISMVNSNWQSRYLEKHFKERWVLPPGSSIPFRQLPWPGKRDSTIQTRDGRWLLTSAANGIRLEIITAQISEAPFNNLLWSSAADFLLVVDKVLAEYECLGPEDDLHVFCDNLSRKYEGVRVEDALWIIQATAQIAKNFFPELMLATTDLSKVLQQPIVTTSTYTWAAANNQDSGQHLNPQTAPRSMRPKSLGTPIMATNLEPLEPTPFSPSFDVVKANVSKRYKQPRWRPYEPRSPGNGKSEKMTKGESTIGKDFEHRLMNPNEYGLLPLPKKPTSSPNDSRHPSPSGNHDFMSFG